MSQTKKIFLCALCGCAMLVTATFASWRIHLAYEINVKLKAIRTAGLPTNGEEENNYYPAIPDDENAALEMGAAFALITNYTDRRAREIDTILYIPRKDVLVSTQTELLAGYCIMNSNALAKAREAIQLPKSRYPIDLSWGVSTLLPHLEPLKNLARAAEFQAALDPNDATNSISIIIGMAHTLDNEPVLVSKLVRIALVNLAVATLERRLNTVEMNDTELISMSSLFTDTGETNQMVNGLIGERATMIPYFRMSRAEIQKQSQTSEDGTPEPNGPILSGSQPLTFKSTGFFERDLLFFLQAMETNISLAAVYPKNIPHITDVQSQISKTSRHNYYILSSMFLPALDTATTKEANEVAKVRCARIAIAIERFRQATGELPENLNILVPQFLPEVPSDPYDGQPLRYRHLEKGYVVYSIGTDGEDNGGREMPMRIKYSDNTHYDITFTVER